MKMGLPERCVAPSPSALSAIGRKPGYGKATGGTKPLFARGFLFLEVSDAVRA